MVARHGAPSLRDFVVHLRVGQLAKANLIRGWADLRRVGLVGGGMGIALTVKR